MTALWPLYCAALLTGCAEQLHAPASAFTADPWPSSAKITTQKDVAKYIVRGKSAYDSCTVNLDTLHTIYTP